MLAIDFPFRISNGSITTTDDYDRIVRAQVIDVVATNQGERLMNPQWGCNLQAAMFEPADHLERTDLQNYTQERINALLPRASVSEVTVDSPNADPNSVVVGISYTSSRYAPTQTAEVQFVSEGGSN